MLSVKNVQSLPIELAAREVELKRTVSEAQHPRKTPGHLNLMKRHHQRYTALPCQPGQRVDGLKRTGRVERGQRLVDEPETGLRECGSCQRHPLTLPTREAINPIPQLVFDVKVSERRTGARNVCGVHQGAQAGGQ